ncbi:HNH endonuclease, partial [Candidatus Woesearchaeota archaeon]|nr:HNH endonuclease [Candidatus Woesearchaeota archaeon]
KNKKDKVRCHTIGNLVPLSIAINSKLQDNDFSEKRERYKEGSLSEREIYDNYSDWDEKTIKNRGLKLLEFISKRWDIDLKDEEFKLGLLGF